jgi:Ca2+-binding RTX toxin-like protein
VTFQDDDGGTAVFNKFVTVDVVAIQQDPLSGENALAIGGTPNNDTIRFDRGVGPDDIVVSLNGADQGTFSLQELQQLVAFGRGGDDTIEVAGSISLDAWLHGGPGNDRLKGGAGHDVILGGEGNDLLAGKDGLDVLLGGIGADRIVGNAHDDILIAGYLDFVDLDAALCAITKEWTSGREYEVRIQNLYNGAGTPSDRLNDDYFLKTEDETDTNGNVTYAATVLDDNSKDVLTGSAGMDWFFCDESSDKITDLHDEAFANELDWILSG